MQIKPQDAYQEKNRAMKTKITTALILASLSSFAQQEIMYSQYMNNQLAVNPAYAGSKEYPSATFINRKQWVGFDGAPTTQALSIHSPILRKNVGLGLMVENDRIGVTGRLNVYGAYSYQLNLGFGNRLSAGIQGGISHYSSVYSNPEDFKVWDKEDPVFAADRRVTVPNFGFGIYYQFKDKIFGGLSVPRLIDYRDRKKFDNYLSGTPKDQRHFYFLGGFSLNAGMIKIKPSTLVRYVPAAPVQADINITTLWAEALSLGVSYRTGDAIIAMAGFRLDKKLRVGYSFDLTVSRMKYYSSNSHEFLLGYDLYKEVIKMKTPRFF